MRRRINTHENQLILPFGQRKGMVISYENRLRVFWALATVSLVSLVAYIYAINAATRNIALRQNLEREMTDMSRSLDSLEFAYVEARNNVTLEIAYEKGFKEEKSPLFVSRNKAASLSFNTASSK